jgi:site-specific recombinase XerD
MNAIRNETARSVKGAWQRALGHPTASNALETSLIVSFETIAQWYLAYQRKRLAPESLKRIRKIIRANLIPYFGPQRAATTFTAMDIAAYLSERSKRVSTASLAKEVSVIKHIFQNALESNLINSNPAIGTMRPKVSGTYFFLPLCSHGWN